MASLNFTDKENYLDKVTRLSTRARLVAERKNPAGGMKCELCHTRWATDLHEIVNRVHYRTNMLAQVPDSLLSLLCNECNTTLADTRDSRRRLLFQNVSRYGWEKVRQDIHDFSTAAANMSIEEKLLDLVRE